MSGAEPRQPDGLEPPHCGPQVRRPPRMADMWAPHCRDVHAQPSGLDGVMSADGAFKFLRSLNTKAHLAGTYMYT